MVNVLQNQKLAKKIFSAPLKRFENRNVFFASDVSLCLCIVIATFFFVTSN